MPLEFFSNCLVFFKPSLELVSENLDAKHTAPPVPIEAKSLIAFTVKSLDTAMYTQSGMPGNS
ncbi:uncharacterized protein METZ01_LOCUS372114 [marine metagenome]|uniref:Uncharacterized protein n=1 Tax=marine metagenome TaxID=408172 RepID=A0A382TAW1_9ZZZZ